jgi:hypothetical protein
MINRRSVFGAVVACVLTAVPAAGHNLEPQPVRELVRIQGYKVPAPQAVKVEREVVFVVLGQQLRFAANEWRSFAFHDPTASKTPPPDPPQLSLQGERSLLRSISTARPDQRITILAERRPGSAELFLLSVDLCPSSDNAEH